MPRNAEFAQGGGRTMYHATKYANAQRFAAGEVPSGVFLADSPGTAATYGPVMTKWLVPHTARIKDDAESHDMDYSPDMDEGYSHHGYRDWQHDLVITHGRASGMKFMGMESSEPHNEAGVDYHRSYSPADLMPEDRK